MLAIIAGQPVIDGAILDVSLRGEMVFPVADALVERGVPFIFATGYDSTAFPARFDKTGRFGKPIDVERVTQAIGRMAAE